MKKNLNKKYYDKNREELLEKKRKYYQENKEKIANKKREFYSLNKEKIIEHNKQYYEINKEKTRSYQKQYRKENRERLRDYDKNKYHQDPRPKMLTSAKSRAKKLGIPFNLLLDDIIIPKFCPILGIEIKIGTEKYYPCSPSLDRVLPELGYVKEYVCVISFRANTLKNDGTLEEHQKICEYIKRNINDKEKETN